MPKLLESRTFVKFFELDKENETFGLSEDAVDKWVTWNQYEVTENVHGWAQENYPNASKKDHCCFAGLITYFATGWYGGYGTADVQKERIAERKAYDYYNHLYQKLSAEDMTIAMIYFVVSHLLQETPAKEAEPEIQAAIQLLEDSKKSFKSKQVAEARKILQGIIK